MQKNRYCFSELELTLTWLGLPSMFRELSVNGLITRGRVGDILWVTESPYGFLWGCDESDYRPRVHIQQCVVPEA